MKKAVLVGPAPYIENKELGNIIDSFDIVARCNVGYKMTKDTLHFGSKTDILFHCVCQDENNGGKLSDTLINDYNIKKIYFVYPKLVINETKSFFNKGTVKNYKKIPENILKNASIINKEEYIKLEKEMDTRPNTGIIALYILLQDEDINMVYLTGFTFFSGGFISLYRDSFNGKKNNVEEEVLKVSKKNKTHDQDKIKLYFVKHFLHHPKLYVDKYLVNLLLEDKNINPYINKNKIKIF